MIPIEDARIERRLRKHRRRTIAIGCAIVLVVGLAIYGGVSLVMRLFGL